MSNIPTGATIADGAALVEQSPYDRQWLGSILRPALIAVMITCLDLAIISLMVRFNPALANGYAQIVVTISILSALFACAATAWLSQPGRRQWRQPLFRLVEFCFVMILARLLTWFAMGTFPNVQQLLYRPLENLLDGSFVFAAIVIGLSWLLAGMFTEEMLRLALQPDELFAIENDRIGELVRTSNSDRPAILQKIVARWVGGGVILVLIAASVRVDRPGNGFFAITRQNIDPTIIAAVVIYFLAGLLLISQGQLAILRTRWLIDRVPTSDQVLGRWPLYVFGLLLIIGLLAALLPFGGTFVLAQILYGIVTLFFNTIYAIFRFFMGLLLLLIATLAGDAPPEEAVATPPPPPPPALEELLPAATQMPEWLGGAFFWIIMALFLGYAAYVYFHDKGIKFTWLAAFWQLIRARWRELFGAYQQWQQTRLRTDATEEAARPGQARKRFQRQRDWRRLAPTARVRYFYLALLEQAKEQGFARATGETPLQYAPRLGDRISPPPVVEQGDSPTTKVAQPTSTEVTDVRGNEPAANEQAVDKQANNVVDQAVQTATHETAADDSAADDSAAHEYVQDVSTITAAFMRTRYANGLIEEPEAAKLEETWKKLESQLQRTK